MHGLWHRRPVVSAIGAMLLVSALGTGWIALQQAEAQVAAAQASIENIDALIEVQNAQIDANQAQVDQAQAALVFAQQQAARYQHLEQAGYGTVQNSEQYTSQLRQQQAALQSAQRLAAMERLMLGSPDQQISLTDHDSRSMAISARG